jgi:K+-sensing histidine kinase KdpD
MTEDTPVSERVVVALNVLRHDIDVLELAAHLAARKQAQLVAYYVEETNLIHLAELPFAMEIDRFSATERKIDLPRMMRTLRTSTEQIQKTLYRLNERLHIDTSFRTLRGHFVSAVMSEIEQVDVVFLSRRTEPHKSRVAKKAAHYPLWVVFDGSAESARALRMAVDLALLESTSLCVALPAETDRESEALKRQVVECCVPNVAARFVSVHPFDASNLLRSMRHTGCRLLVIKRQNGGFNRAVSETIPCPVVLV